MSPQPRPLDEQWSLLEPVKTNGGLEESKGNMVNERRDPVLALWNAKKAGVGSETENQA